MIIIGVDYHPRVSANCFAEHGDRRVSGKNDWLIGALGACIRWTFELANDGIRHLRPFRHIQ